MNSLLFYLSAEEAAELTVSLMQKCRAKFACSCPGPHCELLREHLREVTYAATKDIVAHVDKEFDVEFTVSGMRQWLMRNGFSYIKPKVVPGNADANKQRAFLRRYHGNGP